jgi:uncharacterized protein YaeQ
MQFEHPSRIPLSRVQTIGSKSTVYKVELPSEPDRRLMARLLVFGLFANERLEFGRGLSTEDEPDLWRRDLTNVVEQWIELGQPDESKIRRACGLAKEVIVVTYSGNSAEVWWTKNVAALSKVKNLRVLDLDADALEAATRMLDRRMTLSATIQDGDFQLSNGTETVSILYHRKSLNG